MRCDRAVQAGAISFGRFVVKYNRKGRAKDLKEIINLFPILLMS